MIYKVQEMKKKDAMPTIEWDVKAPEDRIKEIVNGRAFSDGTKILNLRLYNGKGTSDYLESEQEKADRIKNARIYGIDPGSIQDVEKINNLSEVDLYFMIDTMGGHIWRCKHDMAHGRIPEIDLTEEQYALEYMAYQTTKFGVELPIPEIDKHITATPSYNACINSIQIILRLFLLMNNGMHFNKRKEMDKTHQYLCLVDIGQIY